MVVDEEIYRRLPSLLITTVDKFAQMPWKGAVQMLFGQVDGFCERHGFRSPEIADAGRTEDQGVTGKFECRPARCRRTTRCGHPTSSSRTSCISSAGRSARWSGLYETAIDRLCTWEVERQESPAQGGGIDGDDPPGQRSGPRPVPAEPEHLPAQRPGRAGQLLLVATQVEREDAGPEVHRHLCSGPASESGLIRVYVALLSAGQVLVREATAKPPIPWMTLVGYFNSLRELGGMRRLVDDDVRTRLRKMADRGLAKRTLYTPDTVKELTSRLGSAAIPETLDRLESRLRPGDPGGDQGRKEAVGRTAPERPQARPLDVLLATNMISVGVDVPRLGLMVVRRSAQDDRGIHPGHQPGRS